jgi:hypothetical protein
LALKLAKSGNKSKKSFTEKFDMANAKFNAQFESVEK